MRTPAENKKVKIYFITRLTVITFLTSASLTINTAADNTVPISHININDEPAPAYDAHTR